MQWYHPSTDTKEQKNNWGFAEFTGSTPHHSFAFLPSSCLPTTVTSVYGDTGAMVMLFTMPVTLPIKQPFSMPPAGCYIFHLLSFHLNLLFVTSFNATDVVNSGFRTLFVFFSLGFHELKPTAKTMCYCLHTVWLHLLHSLTYYMWG